MNAHQIHKFLVPVQRRSSGRHQADDPRRQYLENQIDPRGSGRQRDASLI
jgi:hypothetical protein